MSYMLCSYKANKKILVKSNELCNAFNHNLIYIYKRSSMVLMFISPETSHITALVPE